MYSSAFVLGFHGCDEAVGERVLAGKAGLATSENPQDWLGHGIYFWENSPERAKQWAEFLAKRPRPSGPKITKPFVIGAIIDLGRCLDLTEANSLELVRQSYWNLKALFELLDVRLPQNEKGHDADDDLLKRNLDCAVINNVHAMREDEGLSSFESVRGAFFEGKPLYEGGRIMAKTHIQVCVRNEAMVRGYFRPRRPHLG